MPRRRGKSTSTPKGAWVFTSPWARTWLARRGRLCIPRPSQNFWRSHSRWYCLEDKILRRPARYPQVACSSSLDQQKSTRSSLMLSDIMVATGRNFRIVGCFVYHWACSCLQGNIILNFISRSFGWGVLSTISMIHGQPAFERTENMFIIMHIALNQKIRSGKVRTCKPNDWGNANAFFLAVFWDKQHGLTAWLGWLGPKTSPVLTQMTSDKALPDQAGWADSGDQIQGLIDSGHMRKGPGQLTGRWQLP